MRFIGTGSADSHIIRYRPDIDGLRAVAVISVIAYHIWREALPGGGFLGVDIFFVFSGFDHFHYLGGDTAKALLARPLL
jgi:peptidoglycan/LPS O-acetylase OafA/YrhL